MSGWRAGRLWVVVVGGGRGWQQEQGPGDEQEGATHVRLLAVLGVDVALLGLDADAVGRLLQGGAGGAGNAAGSSAKVHGTGVGMWGSQGQAHVGSGLAPCHHAFVGAAARQPAERSLALCNMPCHPGDTARVPPPTPGGAGTVQRCRPPPSPCHPWCSCRPCPGCRCCSWRARPQSTGRSPAGRPSQRT